MENKSKMGALKLLIIVFGIFGLICLMATWQDLSRLQNTREDGIWTIETLTSEGEVTAVGEIYFRRNGGEHIRPYNIEFTIDAISDYSHSTVSDEELAQYHVGDRIIVTREVYYLKPGFRIYTRDFVSKG